MDETLKIRFLLEVIFKGNYDGIPYFNEKTMQNLMDLFEISDPLAGDYYGALNKLSRFFMEDVTTKDGVQNVKKQERLLNNLLKKVPISDKHQRKLYL